MPRKSKSDQYESDADEWRFEPEPDDSADEYVPDSEESSDEYEEEADEPEEDDELEDDDKSEDDWSDYDVELSQHGRSQHGFGENASDLNEPGNAFGTAASVDNEGEVDNRLGQSTDVAVLQSANVLSMLVQCSEGEGHRLFSLEASYRFTGLAQRLADYSSIPVLCKGVRFNKMPLHALIALCLNEYAAISNVPGRTRQSWARRKALTSIGSPTLYFALRAWTEQDRKAWQSWTPSVRLLVSSVVHPFHWSSGDTLVLPIQIINRNKDCNRKRKHMYSDHYIQRFIFEVPGEDLSEVKNEHRKVMFLLYFRSRVIVLTWDDLFSLPIVKDPRGDEEMAEANIPSGVVGPAIARSGNYAIVREDGMISVALLIRPLDKTCNAWLQEHALPEEDLEANLIQRFRDEVLKDGSRSLTQRWSSAYDQIMLVEDRSDAQLKEEAKQVKEESKIKMQHRIKNEYNAGLYKRKNAKRRGVKNPRWTPDQEELCCKLLNEGARLGLDDSETLSRTSTRLLSHGYTRSSLAISARFQRADGEWKSINGLRGTPKRRDWTVEEDDVVLAMMGKLDTSMPLAKRALKVSEAMRSEHQFERTPTQVRSRWSGYLASRNPKTVAKSAVALASPTSKIQTLNTPHSNTPPRKPLLSKDSSLSDLPLSRRLFKFAPLAKPALTLPSPLEKDKTLNTPDANTTSRSRLLRGDLKLPDSPLSRRSSMAPTLARPALMLPTPTSKNRVLNMSDADTTSRTSLLRRDLKLPDSPLSRRLFGSAPLAKPALALPPPTNKNQMLNTPNSGSALRFSNLSVNNPRKPESEGTPTPRTHADWLPEEDDALLTLMAKSKGMTVEDALEKAARDMWEDYEFSRSAKSCEHRWYEIRPEHSKASKTLRPYDWKPNEEKALQILLASVDHLPRHQQSLEISQSLKSRYDFDRSPRAVLHKLEQLSRSSQRKASPKFWKGKERLRDDEDSEDEGYDEDDEGEVDDEHREEEEEDNRSKTPLPRLTRASSKISASKISNKHTTSEDAEPQKSTISETDWELDGEDEVTAKPDKKDKKTGRADKFARKANWTQEEERLCRQTRKQVMRSAEFSTKGVNDVWAEVAKRIKKHGYNRTGLGIRNHFYKVEKPDKGKPPKPRWTPEKLAALLSLMEELSTVKDTMERFQRVAEKMEADFDYTCTATQVKRKWYEHLKKEEERDVE